LGSLVRPLRLPGFVDDAMARGASARSEIQRALEDRSLDAEAMVLAPLLERYDATQVAAALLALWSAARDTSETAGASAPVSEPATARIWVSVGQRDQATPGDLVAALVKELGVDRSQIGKIEMRESFSLVQLPATDAERIAERLTGVMIRRRKVAARIDRGRRA
jgi:ATP-dependent RNA helicase DeaD